MGSWMLWKLWCVPLGVRMDEISLEFLLALGPQSADISVYFWVQESALVHHPFIQSRMKVPCVVCVFLGGTCLVSFLNFIDRSAEPSGK